MALTTLIKLDAIVVMLLVLGACGGGASIGESTATDGSSMTVTMSSTFSSVTVSTSSDPDSSTTDGESSTSGDDTTTGGPVCPPTHACLEIPADWTGPVLLRESTDARKPGTCPAEYPDIAASGGTDVLAPAAECSCDCGDATGTTCALATTLHHWGDDSTCSLGTPSESFNLFTTICNALGVSLPANSFFQVEPVVVEGGACVPESAASIPTAVFTRLASTCSGAELLEGCAENELCAPLAAGESLCVWQAGESDCPEGFDARQEVYYGAIDDTRACDECSCGEPLGLCENASITMFSNVCNPPVSGVVAATGECYPGSAFSMTQSAIFSIGDPNAFCVASDPVPTGVATPSEPVTVCCAE